MLACYALYIHINHSLGPDGRIVIVEDMEDNTLISLSDDDDGDSDVDSLMYCDDNDDDDSTITVTSTTFNEEKIHSSSVEH